MNEIDSKLMKDMLLGGARVLENKRGYVNSLNVFPVPDGDTGINMYMTVSSAVRDLANLGDSFDLKELAEIVTKGALKGARGNSGVILSQILKGFFDVIGEKEIVKIKDFSEALKEATTIAYGAVTKPKEGTILSVIRVMAEQSQGLTGGKNNTFEKFLDGVYDKGIEILNRTPDMLPVLKKAGVVDAGGYGLMCIIDGMRRVLKGEEIEQSDEVVDAVTSNEDIYYNEVDDLESITFAYCTEFFIINLDPRATTADIDKLRDKYMTLGDSVIVIGDLNLVKVHVHTNNPGVVLQSALNLGELDKIKIENMLEQNRTITRKAEMDRKEQGMIAVCCGDGFKAIFKELNVDLVVEGGQTMNPSVDDILLAIRKVNADNIFIMPNNKNIILACEQAKEMSKKNCIIIPTVNVQSGVSAALVFSPEIPVSVNQEHMLEAAAVPVCGQVTTAVRSTTMNGFKLKEGDIIGLSEDKIMSKGGDLDSVTINLINKLSHGRTFDVLSLYYGEEVTEEQAAKLVQKINERIPELEVAFYNGGQPHYFYFVSLE